jgi:hypothetical protein
MKSRIKIQFLASAILLGICFQLPSCRKDDALKSTLPVTTASDATAGASFSKTYTVGTGSGSLTIDGKTTAYASNSLIVVKPGTYQTITFQNLSNVTIENGSGVVIMDGTSDIYAGVNFTTCNNVTITRNPAIASTVPYGFICQNVSYRPTTISGVNTGLTMAWVSYNNIGDYAIHVTYSTPLTWKGTNATLQGLNLKFTNCNFNNCNGNAFSVNGSVTTSGVTGLQKGFTVDSCIFTNCNSGDLIFGAAMDQYNIYDNMFSNANATNNNDNGLAHITGNGNFFRNYANNYQGHMIRMWTISFGTTPETCLVYDNIGINSREYSPFEWQSTSGDNVPIAPNTTYVNIRLNNNTAGNLNTSHNTSFYACLVENYAMPAKSTQEVYNNLLYNTYTSSGTAPRFFQFNSTTAAVTALANQGNLYLANSSVADFVANITTSAMSLYLTTSSPAKNKGVPGHLISPYDILSLPFYTSRPSIGAVE